MLPIHSDSSVADVVPSYMRATAQVARLLQERKAGKWKKKSKCTFLFTPSEAASILDIDRDR
jgi:hypothetical protein